MLSQIQTNEAQKPAPSVFEESKQSKNDALTACLSKKSFQESTIIF